MSNPIKIIVGHRGWVWVGRVERDGSRATIRGARCVRRWGTKRGLGQLATEGPLPDTELDDAADVTLHELAIVAEYACREEAWSGAV